MQFALNGNINDIKIIIFISLNFTDELQFKYGEEFTPPYD
jgi:hypothetical protein